MMPELGFRTFEVGSVAALYMKLGSFSARVFRACEEERHLASVQRSVSLHVALSPVFGPHHHEEPILLACHELLRNSFSHAYAPNECASVGVHMWSAESETGLITYLLVADAGCGFEGAITPGSGLARTQAAVGAAGGMFLREPGAGTIWRIVLPFSSVPSWKTDAESVSLNGAIVCH
jgi:two-component sensor histidine kinase